MDDIAGRVPQCTHPRCVHMAETCQRTIVTFDIEFHVGWGSSRIILRGPACQRGHGHHHSGRMRFRQRRRLGGLDPHTFSRIQFRCEHQDRARTVGVVKPCVQHNWNHQSRYARCSRIGRTTQNAARNLRTTVPVGAIVAWPLEEVFRPLPIEVATLTDHVLGRLKKVRR